jgi:hypothetical protein
MKAFFQAILRFFGLLSEEPPSVPNSWKPQAPAGPPPTGPGFIPTAPSFDYARYNKAPYEIMTRDFPGGLPVGWNWSEWARVNGRVDPTIRPPSEAGPDRTGGDLGSGYDAPRVNVVHKDEPRAFRFERRGDRAAVIRVFGQPGQFFQRYTDSMNGVMLHRDALVVGTLGYEVDVTHMKPGWHTYEVAVDAAGTLGVQFAQQYE